MRAFVFRTAMCGGGLSYDVYVPVEDAPEHVRKAHPGGTYHTQIGRDGRYFYNFEDATRTPEHEAMEQGIERYESWLQHEKAARARMLEIAKSVFPELAPLKTWPILWVNGLGIPETHAVKQVTL